MIEERRLRKKIVIPEGIDVEVDETLTVRKGKLSVQKKLFYPTVEIKKQDGAIILQPKRMTKNEKRIINTFRAHIINMIRGIQEPFVYKVKICSSHFPMSVSIEGKTLVIKNFFGEKVPRRAFIHENVEVKIDGDTIVISSPDIERAGQTAANFEQGTRITNRDRRVFQDGLWIVEKGA